jgi:ribonuclease HI
MFPETSKTPLAEYDYVLTFDGGADPNPGKGYGSYHLKTRKGRERLNSRIQFGDYLTNNQTEYMALIAGLEDLVRTIEQAGKQPANYTVAVYGDSSLVIKQLKGEWKVKDAKMEPLYREALEKLRRFKKVDLHWHDRSNSVRLLGH